MYLKSTSFFFLDLNDDLMAT